MGVSYYAKVVFGVPYTSERRSGEVTRYHEVTGKSYQKTVMQWAKVPLDRKTATTFPEPLENDHYDDWMENLDHGGDGGGVIGICLNSVNPAYNECESMTVPDICLLANQLREKLTPHYTPQEVAWFMTHARLNLTGYAH